MQTLLPSTTPDSWAPASGAAGREGPQEGGCAARTPRDTQAVWGRAGPAESAFNWRNRDTLPTTSAVLDYLNSCSVSGTGGI